MCSRRHPAPTFTLILLAAACSSKQSQDSENGDGSSDANDASHASDVRPPDGRDAQVERGLGGDAVDSVSALDARSDWGGDGRDAAVDGRDAAVDGRDALDGRGPDGAEVGISLMDARDAADGPDARDSAGPDSKTDSTIDTPYGGVADAPRDAPKDAAKEAAPPDRPTYSGPHSCASPIQIPADPPAHVDLALTTTGANHLFDFACGDGGPQVVLSFNVNLHELVYADTFGATWNTMLTLSTTCPPSGPGSRVAGMVACNDDACNTSQSQVLGELTGGTYYIIVGGANGESGDVTLHFQHAQAGNGPLEILPAGTGVLTGATVDDVGAVDICLGPANDNSYWWMTCPDYVGGAFTASTCDGTDFDSVLALQIPRANVISCNDDYDACGSKSLINANIPPGAGLNVLTVDGATLRAFGNYQVTYTRP